MICTEALVVKYEGYRTSARIMHCRSWKCPICRPLRQKELIAKAIEGRASKFLTLTVRDTFGTDPVDRARHLVSAWRDMRLDIHNELLIPEELRWLDKKDERWEASRQALRLARKACIKEQRPTVEFLAVIEATQAGEPHVHIIMRAPFIPQAWLSDWMAKRMDSPIVWIEAVDQRRKLATYVAKYCGKSPQRFGTLKRYWTSAKWQPRRCDNAPIMDGLAPLYQIIETNLDSWIAKMQAAGDDLRIEGKWIVAERVPPPYDETEQAIAMRIEYELARAAA